MPERYELSFAAPALNGAVMLDLFDDHAAYWMYVDLAPDGFVAIRHDRVALPRGPLLQVRADGLWAEFVCEVPGEHWTFGLEAFGLLLDDRDEARTAEVGERTPVGFDLEWDEGRVIGEVLVGQSRLAVDGRGTFVQTSDAPDPRDWADWLDSTR
jgi:hypothetical protein